MADRNQRWHTMKAADCASEVVSIVDWLDNEQAPLKRRALNSLSLYEGRRIPSLDPTSYGRATEYDGDGFERLYFNQPRIVVHAATAKIAGRTRPKSQVVASDADWETKRKAKKLERFVEAQMSQPQGRYRDGWALSLRVFQDALTAIGRGTMKIFADTERGSIVLERVLPWEVFTDPRETRSGCRPMNRFQKAFYDKDLLADKFPSQRDMIWNARTEDTNLSGVGASRSTAAQVPVYEGWRLPSANGKGGRHVLCIDGVLLASDEWERNEFPFVDIYWAEEFLGDGGTSLVEEVETVSDELNYTAERMREKMRLGANLIGSYEEGSVDPALLKSNENAVWLPRKPGSTAPTWTAPGAFSEQDMAWFNMHWAKGFEVSRVSQATATSRKEPGVTSGIALRTVSAIETEQFSVQATAYEQMVAVDIPRHIIACARQLYQDDKHFYVRWAGGSWLQQIPWADVDMDDDMYVIQPYSVSGLVNTPADRLQLAQDFFNAGIIGKDAFARISQMGGDVASELQRGNAQYALIEKYIEDWLSWTPERERDGQFRYYPPIPFMDHAAAIVQVAGEYMVQQKDGAPEGNLRWFLTFMQQCDAEIKKIEAYRAGLTPKAHAAPTQLQMADAPQQQMVQ